MTAAPIALSELIGKSAAESIERLRRDLHQHPEIGMNTIRTAQKVENALQALNPDELQRFAGCGIAALFRGAAPSSGARRMLGFRADMDALPAPDESGAPYASVNGCAHLCGHDGHTAGLLAFAHWLAGHRAEYAGDVLLIFQPGEEGYAGAKQMIDDGLCKTFDLQEIYAVHGDPEVPLGQLKFRPGAMTASASLVKIVVEGQGGHGSRPHQAVDSVPAAAELVLAVQTIVSRNVDPQDSAVVSLASMNCGDLLAASVIPARVELAGTVRTFDNALEDRIEARMHDICRGIGEMNRCRVSLEYKRLYPVDVNDPELTAAVEAPAAAIFGKDNLLMDIKPYTVAEDFAFFSLVRPTVLFFLGLGDDKHSAKLHNPHFDFNDKALGLWTALFAEIAKRRLPRIEV